MSDQYSEDDNSTLNGADGQSASEIDSLEPSTVKCGILRNPLNEGTIFKRIQYRRYICGVCGKEKAEQGINKHHAKNHSDVPFTMEIYELCEIDERIQCLICNTDKLEKDFDKHINECHSETIGQQSQFCSRSVYNAPPNGVWLINPIPNQIDNHYMTANWCESQAVYDKLPSNDAFQIIHHQQKTLCDSCGTRLEKPTGFKNVCISDAEFHRFLSHNRIYHNSGRLYLKDSK